LIDASRPDGVFDDRDEVFDLAGLAVGKVERLAFPATRVLFKRKLDARHKVGNVCEIEKSRSIPFEPERSSCKCSLNESLSDTPGDASLTI
jgi:hypothetical protein